MLEMHAWLIPVLWILLLCHACVSPSLKRVCVGGDCGEHLQKKKWMLERERTKTEKRGKRSETWELVGMATLKGGSWLCGSGSLGSVCVCVHSLPTCTETPSDMLIYEILKGAFSSHSYGFPSCVFLNDSLGTLPIPISPITLNCLP